MNRDELAGRIRDAAYLEGDFTLRSGRKSKYYLDKYLFETQPDILAALGDMFAKHVSDSTTLIAGAELGGVAQPPAVGKRLPGRRLARWLAVRHNLGARCQLITELTHCNPLPGRA